jgi:hexosaminidase
MRQVLIASSLLLFILKSTSIAQHINLIPGPKEIRRGVKSFRITGTTRIVVNNRYLKEDRFAAETLGEEIERATRHRLRIIAAPSSMPATNAIFLTRTTDVPSKRRLQQQGLTTDQGFNEEGYLLDTRVDSITIAGQSSAGVFYGVQTLRQLIQPEQNHTIVPAVSIKDWPTMRWRGVHDDVSRGPIPTLEYMKKQIRTLAEYKINLFSIYMENVFDYRDQPLIAPKEASITPPQIEELIAYAQKYFVTILPEQQAFGHLHHVLKYEIYNDLAETPHGHVLAPVNEKSYDLIKSMYAELAPLFPGPLFHIGSDETFELGRGQSKAKANEVGLGRVYLEHLQRVSQIMQPYGKRLMFWADIAEHYPDLLNILPKQMIPVAWEYDPRPSFENMLQPFHNAGFELFVSPGASNWNRIYPNFDAAYVNIHNFVRDGQKFGAIGVLNTTWDDDGESLFEMTWPALVYGAAASWQAGEAPIDQFRKDFDWAFYRNGDSTFIQASNQLSQTHKLLRDIKMNGAYDAMFWEDPFTEQGCKNIQKALPVMHDLRIGAESAVASIYQHQQMAREHAETLDAMLLAGWRLDALGMKVQFTKEINDYYWDAYVNQDDARRVSRDLEEITSINARLEDLRDSTNRVRTMYEKAWLDENRPYWLNNVLVRYDNLAILYQKKIEQVSAARAQYRDLKALPSPESLGFYLKPEEATPAQAVPAPK